MRVTEILALGPQLRREAEGHGIGVNEAHFLVHEVMTRAFADDPSLTAPAALQGELSSRLWLKVAERQ